MEIKVIFGIKNFKITKIIKIKIHEDFQKKKKNSEKL